LSHIFKLVCTSANWIVETFNIIYAAIGIEGKPTPSRSTNSTNNSAPTLSNGILPHLEPNKTMYCKSTKIQYNNDKYYCPPSNGQSPSSTIPPHETTYYSA
jgi:hypothetical protein